MGLSTLLSAASQQVMFLWLLIIFSPFYLIFASLLARGLQNLYVLSKTRGSYITMYVGDISWLLPFRDKETEFKLTHILLLAILIAIISLILLVSALYQQQTEKFEYDIKQRQIKKVKEQKHQ